MRLFISFACGIILGLLVALLLIPDQPDKVYIFPQEMPAVTRESPTWRV